MSDENVSRVLRRLMQEAPGGPLSVTKLAEMIGKPRSTVHRHLNGVRPSRKTLQKYSIIFGMPEDTFLRLAGYETSEVKKEAELQALVVEIRDLDRDGREVIWQMINMLRKISTRGTELGHEASSPELVAQAS